MNSTSPLTPRHHPSGLNSTFQGDGLTFADYMAQSRQMITAARKKLHDNYAAHELDKIIDGNAPFELKPTSPLATDQNVTDQNITEQTKPYRRGILLTHGLSDSPYFMRYLGEFFQQQGFRVMAILLPGHGTQPGDLLDVNWREWAHAINYGTEQLAAEVDEIYLAGFSAGGTLSIYQSLIDDRIRGLFLFSPALQISSLAAYANLHKLFSWAVPTQKWINISPDVNIYKYESLPKNAAAQIYTLIQEVQRRVQDRAPTLPIFTAASMQDSTVVASATLTFVACLQNPSNKLVLYATGTKNPAPGFPADQLEWLQGALPEQKILSSAHTALTLPAEDTYFGTHGSYANCLHYFPHNMEKYEACRNNRDTCWLGETTEENMRVGLLRRLMINPHFAALKVSMQKFIDSLPD